MYFLALINEYTNQGQLKAPLSDRSNLLRQQGFEKGGIIPHFCIFTKSLHHDFTFLLWKDRVEVIVSGVQG